jgi:hypothetical protein
MHGPAGPELSELEVLRLDRAWLHLENAQLRLAIVQGQAEAARLAVEALMQAGQRDGYGLRRTDTGAWVYRPLEEGYR